MCVFETEGKREGKGVCVCVYSRERRIPSLSFQVKEGDGISNLFILKSRHKLLTISSLSKGTW